MSYSRRKQPRTQVRSHWIRSRKTVSSQLQTEAAYEPFEYMDGDKIIGYNADLFAKICDDLGVELDYIDLPFQGILADLKQRNMTLLEQHLA